MMTDTKKDSAIDNLLHYNTMMQTFFGDPKFRASVKIQDCTMKPNWVIVSINISVDSSLNKFMKRPFKLDIPVEKVVFEKCLHKYLASGTEFAVGTNLTL